MALTTVNQGLLSTDAQYTGFKNRIINGAMLINQRGVTSATAQQTGAAEYLTVDRWKTYFYGVGVATQAQVTDAPTGFNYSTRFTVTTPDTSIAGSDDYFMTQYIEANNTTDFNFGTASAKALTYSFWVKCSTTGTLSVAFQNYAATRSYVSTVTINAANTWEYKTVTIPGDTGGAWYNASNNPTLTGLSVIFSIGNTKQVTANTWVSSNALGVAGATNFMATSGLTIQFTGCQLEVGSTATSFDYRPYGTELALCQRYYYKWINDTGGSVYPFAMQAYSVNNAYGKLFDLPVTMRATPTCSTSGSFNGLNANGNGTSSFAVTSINSPTKNTISTNDWTGSTGMTAGQALPVLVLNNAFVQASAEL